MAKSLKRKYFDKRISVWLSASDIEFVDDFVENMKADKFSDALRKLIAACMMLYINGINIMDNSVLNKLIRNKEKLL